MTDVQTVTTFPLLFGERRTAAYPPLQRIDFAAMDGQPLCLHHTSGGTRGPVIMTPGTAMTALTYCLDSVPQNIVEFLVEQGFDVWLLDWRTSPILDAHNQPYTLDDVARWDWPAAISKVQTLTGRRSVSVLAHCLSSPTLLLALIRGYIERDTVSSVVASQVALHLRHTTIGTLKIRMHLDILLPGTNMIHQRPADVGFSVGDIAASLLSRILPTTFNCNNRSCNRHVATFGELVLHSRLDPTTHSLMGDLAPECITGFLKDVAKWSRRDSILTDEDATHFDRLCLPIHFISGGENRMFVPRSTEDTYRLLCDRNGTSHYRRTVYPGFGHLDCYFGAGAPDTIWPDLAASLDV